jgi:cystathionine beta-lyase
MVVSDEIHGDLVFTPFVSFGTLDKEFVDKAIICTAASKTFNLAGMSTSNIIVPDKDQRTAFEKYMFSNGIFNANAFGRLATETAYDHGAEWLDGLLNYLTGTLDFMEKYFAKHIPQIRMTRPEGTYLVWLDCRAIGVDSAALTRFFLNEARVYLENGSIFGKEGDGYMRMNIATPRKTVKEALKRMKEAVDGIQ